MRNTGIRSGEKEERHDESGIYYEAYECENKFTENHPKFTAFLNAVFSGGITEGTIIEITVTKPGEEAVTTNMKITQSDLDLFSGLKDLAK